MRSVLVSTCSIPNGYTRESDLSGIDRAIPYPVPNQQTRKTTLAGLDTTLLGGWTSRVPVITDVRSYSVTSPLIALGAFRVPGRMSGVDLFR